MIRVLLSGSEYQCCWHFGISKFDLRHGAISRPMFRWYAPPFSGRLNGYMFYAN